MAADIGFADGLMTKWRAGADPSSSKVVRIAEYLQCSVEYLLTGNNPTISDEDSKIIALYNKAEPLAKDIAILALERGQRKPSVPAQVPAPRKVKDGQTQNDPAERPICIYNTPVAAGIARAESFLFYLPVVLWADSIPILGMLMIPKTICYVWLVVMGFRDKSTS